MFRFADVDVVESNFAAPPLRKMPTVLPVIPNIIANSLS
jgi:hypothetical protein